MATLQAMPDVGGTFAAALRAFEAFMVARGLAEPTRRTYRYQLVLFYSHHAALGGFELGDVPESEIHRYIAELPAHGSARGDAMRALKAFFGGYAVGRLRPDDPARALRIPRGKVVPAPELDKATERALVSAAFRREERRGWAITLCLATGARVSSLVAVRVQDVHLEASEPWVWFAVAKGDRPYPHPLRHRGALAARHLIETGHDPIVGVGAAMFRQWVHAAAQDAGLGRVWPHLLRHTYATRLAQGGDPEAWRRGMNHADLSQWTRYVHGDEARLRDALDRGGAG